MATYRAIAASEIDPDSPVTATLMEALTDNPTAIAEGASGDPRVAVFTRVDASTSDIDFTPPGGTTGLVCDFSLYPDGTGPSHFQVALSDDAGGSFAAVTSIFNTSDATARISGKLTLDVVSGDYKEYHYETDGTLINSSTGTIATPAGTVDLVRFYVGGSTGANTNYDSLALFSEFTGGEAAAS